jgi:YggT family protein
MSYLGNAGQIVFGALFTLAIVVFLLRVLLQAVRANFYNPICQLLHKATQPVIAPLRRVLPPVRRVELAGLAVAWLIGTFKYIMLAALAGAALPFAAAAVAGLAECISLLLWIWFWGLLACVIFSWIPVDDRNPAIPLVYQISEPLLAPIRRLIPPVGGLDLSVMVALILVQVLRTLVVAPLFDQAARIAIGA